MKIAILTPEYISEVANWHGGLSNYLSRIAQGLKERGHEVHIFTYSSVEEILIRDGITIHRISTNDFLLMILNKLTYGIFRDIFQILFIAFYFKRYFLKIYQRENFDIVHSSSCQAPSLFLNSKRIGAPIVTRLSSITRLCQIVSGRRNKLDMYLLNAAEKYLAKKSDQVFTPGWLTKKNALREFGLKVDLIESPEYFPDRKESSLDFSVYERYFKNKKYILFYGTLSKLKGSEFIADVIFDFLNQFEDYYFAIIGKMVPHKKNVLPIEPILFNAREYKNRIIYTNSLRHKFLFPIIKNAQAVFLPSLLDNYPNTMIEAMGIGKIVIGTRDGGFDQLLDDEQNGFLVDYGDKKRLIEIFKIVCQTDNDNLLRIEAAAKETVRKRLNFKERIDELERYYEKAIADYNKDYYGKS